MASPDTIILLIVETIGEAKTPVAPLSVWPHLFRGAGHEKRRGEQLKWSLAFRLYIGSFPRPQLPGPVHTARLGRVFFVYLAQPRFVLCVFICAF